MAEPKDYSQFLVAEYSLWSVFAHENQGYLGRCYVWCKRENARDLTDATVEEWHELHHICKIVESGLFRLFTPTMLNYSFLGNVTRHLHCHVIPRYETPQEFAGMKTEDKFWGQNYQTDKEFVTPPEVLREIIRQMRRHLV